MRKPPFANVAYARAISSGFTACEPSPIEKTAWSGLVIPSRCAVRTTLGGPTTFVSCANTELSETAIAFLRSIVPRYSPS